MQPVIDTTLEDLVAAEDMGALGRLAALRLPVKAAYHVAKLVKLARAEVWFFHEQRVLFIKELGQEHAPTPAQRAQGIVEPFHEVTPENRAEFARRLQELGKVPVTIAWAPLDLAMLGGVEIAAVDLLALGSLVRGFDPEKEPAAT